MTYNWKFFRAGGFDQVRIETADDLLHLAELDPKLWVALACPTKGVEFDTRTLELLDGDGDGRIRQPDLLAAISWTAERLSDTSVLAQRVAGLPLAAIREDGPGAALKAAAQGLAGADGRVTVEAAAAAEAARHAAAIAEWEAAAAQPLGDHTTAAFTAFAAVREKVDDWFLRCRLAAYDGRAGVALNASEDNFKALAPASLNSGSDAVAALPLAAVAPGSSLPLGAGLNPAWEARMAAVTALAIVPLLGETDALSESDWSVLKERLAPFEAWQAGKPASAPEAEVLRDLEKLVRYVRDLMPLANNFVAFRDFYSREGKAMFQVGTLYLDGRSAELCVSVADAARHAALASLSRMYLVYCDCSRKGEKMSIAAAFTAGDSDQLISGRNGVFFDRAGQDWDATVTRVVEQPISLRQAFWSPYRRLVRLVGSQLQKFAGAKAKGIEDRMAAGVADAGKKMESAPEAKGSAAQQAFDVGKFAGIFAAIGLAVGALGTALASIITGLLGLKWWQLPLAVAGLLLLISGPAVLLAWFQLRGRNLGPLLDANGWAVNARARINIPFGTSLTQLAVLPEGSERSLSDPYEEKHQPWGLWLMLLALAGAALWWWLR